MARGELTSDSAELVLLSVLSEGPQYGYAIIKQVAGRSDDRIRLSPGVLYPLLARLERQGLIAGRWDQVKADRADPDAPGRKRKWYRLTPKGTRRLAQRIRAHRSHLALMESFIGRAHPEEGRA